jgi:hypothetical protein
MWPLKTRHPSRRVLEWTAGGDHPFTFVLRQPWWPPFYATAFFLPRLKVEIKHAGAVLPMTSFGLYVGAYDGPVGEIPSADIAWVDTVHFQVDGDWQPGETRRFALTVRSRNLPHEGTYVLKLLVTKFVRQHHGGLDGSGIHTIYVVDYFRVEPISSVLTFGLVVSTLLLALATLGLVIATLAI